MFFHYNNTLKFRQGTGQGAGLGATVMMIDSAGNVAIRAGAPQSKLSIEGPVTAEEAAIAGVVRAAQAVVAGTVTAKEAVVTQEGWPDYVIADGYDLMPLKALAERIRYTGHLQDIPSAETVGAQGVSLGEMQAKLLRKIEELIL